MNTFLGLVVGFLSGLWLLLRLLTSWLFFFIVAPICTFWGIASYSRNILLAFFAAVAVWALGGMVIKLLFPEHFSERWSLNSLFGYSTPISYDHGHEHEREEYTPFSEEDVNYGDDTNHGFNDEDAYRATALAKAEATARERAARMREARASLGMEPRLRSPSPNIATLPTQQGYVSNPAGQPIQHTYGPNPTGSVIVQDGAGRIQAIKEAPTSQGVTVVRAPSGVLEGRLEMRPDGSGTVYDAAGRYQTLIEKPVRLGNSTKTTYRDANQRLIGTKEVTDSGRTEYRKASGALCGPDFK